MWVLRVARNTAIDHVRHARAVSADRVGDVCVPDHHAVEELRSSLRAALAELPPGQRDVLLLTHLVGLAPHEIAAVLGCTVRAVHGLHYRGRGAARVTLTELGAAPAVTSLQRGAHLDDELLELTA